MRLTLNAVLCYGGVICGGVAVGLHHGIFEGIAAALVVYAIMPSR